MRRLANGDVARVPSPRKRFGPGRQIKQPFLIGSPGPAAEARPTVKILVCGSYGGGYSPKYFKAIWSPSSYIFWYSPTDCSARFVLRWKN
jgi:hypothetical protein